MSDDAKNIADYLETNTLGTVGVDIFYNQLPGESNLPASDPVVVVYASGGFDPAINKSRKHFQPTIQVIVTGIPEGYTDAIAKAVDVQDLLTDATEFVVGDSTYYGSYQQGGLNFLGYDANNRPEISLNFRIYRRIDR